MAARESKENGEETSEQQQPPLPDEEPPPLPDEEPPPLPEEDPPPLPDEPVPDNHPTKDDDGWQPVWDAGAGAYYFYNRFTQATQWENPRVPESTTTIPAVGSAPGMTLAQHTDSSESTTILPAAQGGYNPAIHGDWNPNADYAQVTQPDADETIAVSEQQQQDDDDGFVATARFNARTGAFTNTARNPTHTPTAHTDEAKANRQMSAFFDTDALAQTHDGRSLRDERRARAKTLTKDEVRAFRERRKQKKEERRRNWLRD